MTRMSTIYSRLSYGSGTTLASCGVSAKAYAETAKTAKEVSWMLADRIAGLSLSDWAIIVGIACTVNDPSLDECPGTLTACKLRHGEGNELPFGGFPGTSLIRS